MNPEPAPRAVIAAILASTPGATPDLSRVVDDVLGFLGHLGYDVVPTGALADVTTRLDRLRARWLADLADSDYTPADAAAFLAEVEAGEDPGGIAVPEPSPPPVVIPPNPGATGRLTARRLAEIAPHARMDILVALVDAQPLMAARYEINTPPRLCHFLAQTAHESMGFQRIEESLNYSVHGLLATFPARVSPADAAALGRDDATGQIAAQAAIANRVYGGRMGNCEPGDGYLFRGRGLIQLTGRANVMAFAAHMGFTLDDALAYLGKPAGAVESAAWYWWAHGLNTMADVDALTLITRRVNGGLKGLDERAAYLKRAKELLLS